MCILFIALGRHRHYPLIVAANRDEYHRRPTTAMHYWSEPPDMLAGRDEQAGGTWLGVSADGRFCAVTNLHTGQPRNPAARSRGELTPDYFNNPRCQAFINCLEASYHHYNPFNLVFGNHHGLRVFSSADGRCRRIEPGIHSISNAMPDEVWPKMAVGVRRLARLVEQNAPLDRGAILALMRAETTADPPLSDTATRQQSPIFIRDPVYGTRTTTILLFGEQRVAVSETSYDAAGEVTDCRHFTVQKTD